jgi:hypothetical protein
MFVRVHPGNLREQIGLVSLSEVYQHHRDKADSQHFRLLLHFQETEESKDFFESHSCGALQQDAQKRLDAPIKRWEMSRPLLYNGGGGIFEEPPKSRSHIILSRNMDAGAAAAAPPLKLALVLFGQPRLVQKPDVWLSHKKHILDKYDVDVYMHCWTDVTPSEALSTHVPSQAHAYCPPNAREILLERYKPKATAFEPLRPMHFDDATLRLLHSKFAFAAPCIANVHNYSAQLYSIATASRLVDRSVPYDYVIVARYDMTLLEFPDLTKMPRTFLVDDQHPRFPDICYIFPPKYLESQESFYRLPSVFQTYHLSLGDPHTFWEPSPEAMKYLNYISLFPKEDLHPMRIKFMRMSP